MADDELFDEDELDPKIPVELEDDDDLFLGDDEDEEDDEDDLDALGFTKEDEDLF